MYYLKSMNPSRFNLPAEKTHMIPVCLYALHKDPIWYMNSKLSIKEGCGSKFNFYAHYTVYTHENPKIANRYSKFV